MIKTELQTAADKLVREIFGVKAGESVVLTADYDSNAKVLRAVSDSVREVGAQVMVITVPTPGSVGKAADPDLPIEPLAAALCACALAALFALDNALQGLGVWAPVKDALAPLGIRHW